MKTIPIHVCPIAGTAITRKCIVTDCLYHSKANKTGCIARDAEELSLEELSVHKGIDNALSTICTNRKRSVESIKAVLVIDEFLSWLDSTLKPDEYPYVTGYRNPALQKAVTEFVHDAPMFRVLELNWNIGRVCCAIQEHFWRAFEKENKMKAVDFHDLLGVKPQTAAALLKSYVNAALQVKEVDHGQAVQ